MSLVRVTNAPHDCRPRGNVGLPGREVACDECGLIRQDDGSGYSDLVRDGQIRLHMEQSFARIFDIHSSAIEARDAFDDLAFARAVLQLRDQERAALPESPEATNNGD
jgi:hypothetical protein